jgi:hypothetical protein
MQGTELLQDPDFAQTLEKSPFQARDLPGLSTAVADTFQRLTPEQRNDFKEALDELRQMSREELQSFLRLIAYVEKNPSEYPKLVDQMVQSGAFDPEDAPAEYNPDLMAILKVMVEQALQSGKPEKTEGFAKGGIVSLKEAADKVRAAGRDGDTILAHINPLEAGMLKRMGGSGTINPKTGLPEFKFWNSFKKIFKVGAQILGTAALSFFVGPIAAGAIVGGVSSLLSGAKPGDALKSALIGGITGGLGGGASSLLGGGSFMEGAFSGGSLFGGTGGGSGLFSNLFGGGQGAEAAAAGAAEGAAGVEAVTPPLTKFAADGVTQTPPPIPEGVRPTVSTPSSGIASLASTEGLKNLWSNYKLPIILGGGAALIGLSNASKDKVQPSLIQGPTGTQLLAQQPSLYGFNPVNFAQRAPGTGSSVFPGGSYVAPTTPSTRTPAFDFTRVTYPTPFTTGTMMAKAGGHISGPGTGTSDSIPARLSDGEFVMTADAVRGAGKGDRMKGARKMYELMHKFERMA